MLSDGAVLFGQPFHKQREPAERWCTLSLLSTLEPCH